MELITAFELGLLNAWILQVIYLIVSMQPLVFRRLLNGKIKEDTKKLKNISPTHVKKTWYSKILYWLLFIIFIISFILTFFLPLQMASSWFYIGIILFMIGIFLNVFVIQSWIISTPDGPITSGIYRYSRHPMYISFFFSYIGICIATLSLLFLILTFIHISLTFLQAMSEEEYCILKYGDPYQKGGDYVAVLGYKEQFPLLDILRALINTPLIRHNYELHLP